MMRSLRSKLLLSFGGLVLLLSLTLGGAGVRLMYQELWLAQKVRLEDGAGHVADEVQSALAVTKATLVHMAGSREVEDFPVNFRVLALTRFLAGFQEAFTAISYVSAEGYEEVRIGEPRGGDEPVDFSVDPLFLQARQRPGEIVVGPVEEAPVRGEPVLRLVLGKKRYFGDTFVGALVATVPASRITRSIHVPRIGSGGKALLLDARGRLLYGQRNRLLQTLPVHGEGAEFLRRLPLGEAGFTRLTLWGVDSLAAYAPLPETGWTAVTLMPYAEFAAGPQQLLKTVLGALVVVAVLGGLLAYLLATSVTAPLQKLTAAVRLIGQGHRHPQIETTGADEVGVLGRAFAQMVRDLSRTTVSRDYLDNILASMKDALLVIGPDGTVLTANPAACALLDYGAEELEDQPVAKVFAAERQDPADWFDYLVRLKGRQTVTDWRAADGRTIPVFLSCAALFDAAGETEALICVAQDITERLAAEEKLRNAKQFLEAVLNSMTEAITIVEVETFRIVGANRTFLAQAGLKDDEVLGKHCFAVTHHRHSPCVLPEDDCPLRETIATGAPASAEHRHRDAGGEKIWVEIATAPITGRSGGVEHVVHIARDITERKRTDEELRRYAEKLAQSNRDLEEFAYVASHDLQEPLRKVIAFGDRLQQKYGAQLGEQGGDYLERMKGASRRMQTLITDLLALSRVTSRSQPPVAVDLGSVAREVLGDLEVRLEEVGAAVELGPLPTVEADPLQMRQLLQNLFGNAVKFRRPGVPPRVRVWAEEGAAPEGQALWRLFVADNGIGFDSRYQERIFGVFQRLHGREAYEGSGVGLAVCRKIAQRHDGAIAASGRPGEGAVFTVTLPRRRGEAAGRAAG